MVEYLNRRRLGGLEATVVGVGVAKASVLLHNTMSPVTPPLASLVCSIGGQ